MPEHDESREPLAIVGIGCRLPGGADSPERFWDLLRSETDATSVVPESRWNAARYHDPNPAKVGKIVTRRGGFLREIDQFDAQFFGISPREAHSLDPQQRLLLHASWEALEDAGIPLDDLAATDVGVFVGGFTLDYQLLQNQGQTSRYRFKSHSATGMMMTMLANRISYAFDFRGPSMSVDTACSSSLVAVHLGAQSIWSGECDVALAGGVNIMIGPNTAIAESKSGFLSPHGRSKAFDDAADGYARGEGGAIVVIKSVRHALRDGDEIYAQILGTAVTQDGHTEGITVPRGDAQAAAIRSALQRAGVDPAEVSYVEAHGTGTPVGDPIEMRALATALAAYRPKSSPLLIGSVKTNIGHLEAGAGIAGLIKAALVVKNGYIPANLHFQTPSRHVSLDELNIDIPPAGRPFPDCRRRVAGVNSFGFGGTNAHVVLAEPPGRTASRGPQGQSRLPLAVLPISGRSEEALAETAGRLADHLVAHGDVSLPDLSYTLCRRRTHLTYRHTVIADSVTDAEQQLRSLGAGGTVVAARTGHNAPKLAFVCSGMGPQWWGMCRGLLDVFPAFTDSMVRSDRELARYTEWSLLDELLRDAADSRMAETEFAQPANFAIQVALAEQLAQFGIRPDAVVGHSAGEVAAHHLAGLLTFEQAVHVVYHRSRLQQRTTGTGTMLAVGLDAETLLGTIPEPIRDEFDKRVSIAAINSPSSVTIAGDAGLLDEVARQLDLTGVFNRRLPVKVPYHSHCMDAVRDELLDAFQGLSSKTAALPLYSTVTGERLDRYHAGAAYWWQNTRTTVLFEPAIRRLLEDGYTQFVELSPHPVLAAAIFETAGAQSVSVIAAQRRESDDSRDLLNCVGALHGVGREVTWAALAPGDPRPPLKLPSYPWQTKRFWNESREAAEALFYNPVHPLLGQAVGGVHPTWEAELSTVLNVFIADHRVQGSVVLPGAAYVEMALAAASEVYGVACSVGNLILRRAVILDEVCDPIVRTTLNAEQATLEFAAFTATANGESKWEITASAELAPLPAKSSRHAAPEATDGPESVGGDDFYRRTAAKGLDYGDAFRSIRWMTTGEDWAVAELAVPPSIRDELDDYRFHPALLDGAFQTLFGIALPGQAEQQDPYLPNRIRRCAIVGSATERMRVHVKIVSATEDEVESDITITDLEGATLAIVDGFSVRALGAATRMSNEHIDGGLLELDWVATEDVPDAPDKTDVGSTWLVLVDESGLGSGIAAELREHGHRVHEVSHCGDGPPTGAEDAHRIDPRSSAELGLLLGRVGRDLGGIVDCWPLDIDSVDNEGHCTGTDSDDIAQHLGVFTLLRLAKELADRDHLGPRIHVVTANTQPVAGSGMAGFGQAPLWGLGRVLGHQELPERWGGLIDIDRRDDRPETIDHICRHVLGESAEDQIAIRAGVTYVPRLRRCSRLTRPFPTRLSADATYVITGGGGALGRVVAGYLAERGARHLTLLNRSAVPPRSSWPTLRSHDPQFAIVDMIRSLETLGVEVTTASVDVAAIDQVASWLDDHIRAGGKPIRGLVHAAGAVNDQLLVNLSEDDFSRILVPKITGTRVLHDALGGHDLDFFVMFGSAGSVIASPGQANYAAANAFLDAFAHYRREQNLPALTIGWGPWSVGMVEELKLEKIYAQRGIELITPAVGVRILDRLIGQATSSVVAISADWARARRTGFPGRPPSMFSELDTIESATAADDADGSMLELLAGIPAAEQVALVAEQLRRTVAAVFDCSVADIDGDQLLDDIGLDSMMAMEFRLRINAAFSIDIPLLEILRGVSVNSLTERVVAELPDEGATAVETTATDADPESLEAAADEVDRLMRELSAEELRELLAELEAQSSDEQQARR